MKKKPDLPIQELVAEVDNILQSMSTKAPITMIMGVVLARLMMHSRANGFDSEFQKLITDVATGEFEKNYTLQ
tara:strand:+ start:429 stop:647 length:219 start_codon:yes stop_codon:yes gene_type:complete